MSELEQLKKDFEEILGKGLPKNQTRKMLLRRYEQELSNYSQEVIDGKIIPAESIEKIERAYEYTASIPLLQRKKEN